MGEETPRGDAAGTNRETTANEAGSGWVTTQVAAKSLGVSPRTIRWHIEHGNLEAKVEGKGVRRSWLVSIDSLQSFRDTRQRERGLPEGNRTASGEAGISADSPGSAIRELADRLVEEASRASEFRVRLELSERAESTLREELAEETRRREEAEREREELRRELERLLTASQDKPITIDAGHAAPIYDPPSEPEAQESPVSTDSPGSSESPTPAPGDAHSEATATEGTQRRSWWRRMFGG